MGVGAIVLGVGWALRRVVGDCFGGWGTVWGLGGTVLGLGDCSGGLGGLFWLLGIFGVVGVGGFCFWSWGTV